MSSARPWYDHDKAAEARELLAPVCAWFTDGFHTSALKEAKRLLDERAPAPPISDQPAEPVRLRLSPRTLSRVHNFHSLRHCGLRLRLTLYREKSLVHWAAVMLRRIIQGLVCGALTASGHASAGERLKPATSRSKSAETSLALGSKWRSNAAFIKLCLSTNP